MKNNEKIIILLFVILFFIGYFGGFLKLAAFIPKAVIYIAIMIICAAVMHEHIINGIKSFKKEYLNDALSAVTIAFIVIGALSLAMKKIHGSIPKNSPPDKSLPLMLFSSLIFAPVAEELVNRCALFMILERPIKSAVAVNIICAAIFSFMHLFKMQSGFSVLLFFGIIYFLLGLICGGLYHKTNNIIVAILIHFLWNLFMTAGSLLRCLI